MSAEVAAWLASRTPVTSDGPVMVDLYRYSDADDTLILDIDGLERRLDSTYRWTPLHADAMGLARLVRKGLLSRAAHLCQRLNVTITAIDGTGE